LPKKTGGPPARKVKHHPKGPGFAPRRVGSQEGGRPLKVAADTKEGTQTFILGLGDKKRKKKGGASGSKTNN